IEVDAAQRFHLHLADDVGFDDVPDRDDRGHGCAAYRPRPPPGGPPRPWGISGLPAPGPLVVRVGLRPVTPVTTSCPCCSSPLSSSVLLPSVIPSRRLTGFSWRSALMNSQTRPRDSTLGSGANSASIVCAPAVALFDAPPPLLLA